MKKSSPKTDLEKQLEALPDIARERVWTIQQDSAIIRYWESKGGVSIARILGIPYNTVLRRYKILKERMK
jgi:hypothetical protein